MGRCQNPDRNNLKYRPAHLITKEEYQEYKKFLKGGLKLLDGNVNEFVDYIYYGQELVFLYKGQKFFLEGLPSNGKYVLFLARWDPPADDYIWVGVGDEKSYPAEEFLEAKIWDGRTFWEAESEMRWVDC